MRLVDVEGLSGWLWEKEAGGRSYMKGRRREKAGVQHSFTSRGRRLGAVGIVVGVVG